MVIRREDKTECHGLFAVSDLFAAVNVARHLKTDPEEALTRSTDKFVRRFAGTEKLALERGIDMPSTPIEELDKLWAEVKQEEKLR